MPESSSELLRRFKQKVDLALDELEIPREPKSLYEPIRYALAPGGKRIRPILCMLSYAVFKEDHDRALPLAIASEIFHTFTLLHDDIMDNADTRRGRVSVHKKWNNAVAILSGDMMMGLSYNQIHSCETNRNQDLAELFDDMVKKLCEGQAIDSDFESRNDVSLEEYLHMISLKTGALIDFCTRSGALIADASDSAIQALSDFGKLLGRGFQLQDDLLDLTSKDPKWGKPIGGDLLEGKKTFLSLKARELADSNEDKELIEAFFIDGGIAIGQIDLYRSLFQKLGVLELTKDLALENYNAAIDKLSILDASAAKEALVEIAEQLKSRLR